MAEWESSVVESKNEADGCIVAFPTSLCTDVRVKNPCWFTTLKDKERS